LAKENVLVVGLGEVGLPLFDLLREKRRFAVFGLDIEQKRMRELGQEETSFPSEFDVMHVCISCLDKDGFVNTVASYVRRFKPKLVVVNSTVQPGTTMELHKCCGGCLVAHSPVRGVHKSREYLKWELKRWTKYIGGASPEAAKLTQKHFRRLGLRTKVLRSCAETELAKLFETTYRAWMITCFQEMHRISRRLGASFDDVVDFIEDTHRVRLDRPVMFPDVIGGHCLIPNIELLLKSNDSEFLWLILRSNEKRREEKKDESIVKEIEMVRKRAVALGKLALTEVTKGCIP